MASGHGLGVPFAIAVFAFTFAADVRQAQAARPAIDEDAGLSIAGNTSMKHRSAARRKSARRCVLTETNAQFLPYFNRWTLLAALGQRLMYEDANRILNAFMKEAQPLVGINIRSPRNFALGFGHILHTAAASINFTAAQRTHAETEDFIALGLQSAGFFGDEEQQAQLEALETDLCEGMQTFMAAARYEETQHIFLQDDPEIAVQNLWSKWQEAWGPIRVFVKVTTQCRVSVPSNQNVHIFLRKEHQDEWERCANVPDWEPNQFPSAVMACARSDGEHVKSRGPTLDRDRMVRYLGCGGSRMMLDKVNHISIEPPVEEGVSEACSANSEMGREFSTALCGPGSLVSGGCHMYGPFWGIYSAPLERFLGKKVDGGNACPLTGESQCGVMPQVEAFKAMGNDAPADYIYGAAPPLVMSRARAWREGREPEGWEKHMDWDLDTDRRLDPPLWEVLREVELGNSVVIISYGFSGAGKTTTLIGDAEAPVGGGNGLEGVLTIYLKDNANRIQDIRFRAVEVYGRFSAESGELVDGSGCGLWGYDLRENSAKYLGGSSAFVPRSARPGSTPQVDFEIVKRVFADANYTTNLRDVIPPSTQGTINWGAEIKKFLVKIERIRKTPGAFALEPGEQGLAHIRATPNNPKSSRGTLFVTTEIDFKNGETGVVTVVDLAGAEDPAVMVEGFMGFKPLDDVEGCTGVEAWVDGKSSKKLIQKHLHRMGDYSVLNGDLGQCIKMRNFLKECPRVRGKPPKPECTDITLSSGKTMTVAPDSEAPIEWTYQPKLFTFKYKRHTVTFTEEEVLAARDAGSPKHVNELKISSSLAGKHACGKAEDEECPGTWVERLWAYCGKDANGRCVKPGLLDSWVVGQTTPTESKYGYWPASHADDEENVLKGIPKRVVKNSGSPAQRGKSFNDRSADPWKAARDEFWRQVHEVMKFYGRADESRDEDSWELHLKYFASVVGPMVEEAVYINEAMNEMKAFLGLWSKKTMSSTGGGSKSGHEATLWPPEDMKSQVQAAQVVDTAPDTDYARFGYDINMFLQSKNKDESFILQATDGHDEVMMLTMLENLRRPAMERSKDTKVLFGTFVRSDRPGADPNCEGARISLEFAQGVSDSIGWDRSAALRHLV